jgi:predicted phosphate transport protein (TIGR00153 family)
VEIRYHTIPPIAEASLATCTYRVIPDDPGIAVPVGQKLRLEFETRSGKQCRVSDLVVAGTLAQHLLLQRSREAPPAQDALEDEDLPQETNRGQHHAPRARRFGLRIFSKDETLYDLMDALASAATEAAEQFYQLSLGFQDMELRLLHLKDIEHKGDEITHAVMNAVDRSFVTPFDKEDLHHLISSLDDIIDLIEAVAGRLPIYRLTEPRTDLQNQTKLLVSLCQAVAEAVHGLRNIRLAKALRGLLVRIHEMENESDVYYRKALTDLFGEPNADPLYVVKWKEVYDRMELAIDKCESVAALIDSVIVKYG